MKGVGLARAALFGAAVLVGLSCTDASPTSPADAPPLQAGLFDDWLKPTGLLECSPLPYDSVTQTIGPEGGTLAVGRHTLFVPEGALDTAVTITAVAPSDTLRHVRFQPEGLTFQRSAWLTLSYSDCNLLGSFAPKRIAYTTDLFEILEYLLSFDNWWSRTVTGRIQHFSEYAIAW